MENEGRGVQTAKNRGEGRVCESARVDFIVAGKAWWQGHPMRTMSPDSQYIDSQANEMTKPEPRSRFVCTASVWSAPQWPTKFATMIGEAMLWLTQDALVIGALGKTTATENQNRD
jgi:hypothetical protein